MACVSRLAYALRPASLRLRLVCGPHSGPPFAIAPLHPGGA